MDGSGDKPKRKKKTPFQQIKKKLDKKCFFCGEDRYELLDCHRILPGEEGGKYHEANTLSACSSCHRSVHAGYIKIDRKYFTTGGYWVLHWWKGDEELWTNC